MNETSTDIDDSPLSADQRAIAEYYASETYRKATSRHARIHRPRSLPRWPDRVLTPATSFCGGLVGFAVMLFVAGSVAPALVGLLRSRPKFGNWYGWLTALDQTIMFPAIAGFAFAIVTPMFWYGSVLVRFSVALLLVIPGHLAFLAASEWLDAGEGFRFAFTMSVYATFLVIAANAVLAQLWTRWSLSHSQELEAPLAPAGTHNLLELTSVAAVNCAVFLAIDTSEFVELLLLCMAIGFLFSLSLLCMLVAFLRPHRRNLFAASMGLLFAFAGAFVYCGMHAFDAFGWQGLPQWLPEIVGLGIYGTIIYLALMWLGIWWLRSWGWVCLSKQDEKRVRQADESEPWGFWFG